MATTKPRKPARCAVCGSYDHKRTAHGWSGRNMTAKQARMLAAQRKAGR
jgi:hypothetical protein